MNIKKEVTPKGMDSKESTRSGATSNMRISQDDANVNIQSMQEVVSLLTFCIFCSNLNIEGGAPLGVPFLSVPVLNGVSPFLFCKTTSYRWYIQQPYVTCKCA